MERSARIARPLQLQRDGQPINLPPAPCRIEADGAGFLLRWDVPGRTESLAISATELETLLKRHDIVFTSW